MNDNTQSVMWAFALFLFAILIGAFFMVLYDNNHWVCTQWRQTLVHPITEDCVQKTIKE